MPNPDEISGNVVGPKNIPGVNFSIYQNTLDNSKNAWSNSVNNWHSPTAIEYKGNTTYVGNSWSDYAGRDCNSDGIGDSPYPIDGGSEKDSFPMTNRTGTRTLTVCASGCNFTSIQAAINAACPGDTIEVESGTYYEHVNVNKALILKGVGSPVVDGSSTGDVITVNADGCTIQGFVARNSGRNRAGICISSNNSIISNNTAIDNSAGIYIFRARSNIISGNTANNNSWVGIWLDSSSNSNTISDNLASGNNVAGIYLALSSGNTIYQNTLDNSNNAWSNSVNNWHSPTAIEYKGKTTYVGNIWSDYAGRDCSSDGIGDSPYMIPGGSEKDSFPMTNRTGTRTLTVCASGCNFTSMQAAINAACAGDTIEVKSGTYYEHVNVNKSLILKGVGSPVVDGSRTGDVITVNADGCTIQGFVARNSGASHAGIRINSKNNTISSNTAFGNGNGIYLSSSSSNIISGNTATDNGHGISLDSRGISLESSSSNIISGNTANNNSGIGIYFASSCNNNTISDNLASGNYYAGIYLYSSSSSDISGNTANNNYAVGIEVSSSSNNTISDNLASSNHHSGIFLESSSSSIISGNTASNNFWPGIWLDFSSNNTISDNLASGNHNGIYLASSSKNTIYQNTLDNSHNAWSDSANNWHSPTAIEYKGKTTYVGNSWSDYAGWDCNSDGIGDSPYPIPGGSEQDSFPLTNRTGTRTLTVCASGCNFTSIQAAINAACPGDTIEVKSGTYYEHVNVNKSLILKGVGSPVVDGSGTGNAITVTADGCTIQGFVARNSGRYCAGILISSNNSIISNNTAIDNSAGIYIFRARSNIISKNTANNNSWVGIQIYSSSRNIISDNFVTGNKSWINNIGICLSSSSNNTISDNLVNGNEASGIDLSFSSSNIISGNIVNNNSWAGIMLSSSSKSNNISHNLAKGNDHAGISLCSSSSNNISGNTANNNYGVGIELYSTSNSNTISDNLASGNHYGICLVSSSSNIISGNTANNNSREGIWLGSSSNNTISDNLASGNNVAGIYLALSSGNTIYQNTLDNSHNAWSNSVNNWHSPTTIEYKGNTTYVGNIWSDYAGRDCNRDGIGDSAYPIPGGSEQDSFPLTNRTGTRTFTVCASGCNFTSIQAAINAACPGDTIEVKSGTYYEHVIVNKSLILKGVGSPIVDGNSTGAAITVTADGCTIQGFVARNSGDHAGIRINSKNNTISSNTAIGNGAGILLNSSSSNIISGNTATGNDLDGIFLYSSSSNIISGNTAKNNFWIGIFLVSSYSNNIFWNHFDGARSDGDNQWNTTEKVNYYYRRVHYYNYTGNYWSNYMGSDPDHDGIGNAPYSIEGGSEKDDYPLLEGVVLPISDSIQISQEGSLQTVQPSSNAQSVLMVTNLGDSELTNISITDQLSNQDRYEEALQALEKSIDVETKA